MAVGGIEPPGVSKTKTACRRNVEAKATIVIGGRADVVSVGGVRGPRRAYRRVIVD